MSDERKRFARALSSLASLLSCCRARVTRSCSATTPRRASRSPSRPARIDALRQQNDELAARLARIEESLKSLSATNPALELVAAARGAAPGAEADARPDRGAGQRRPAAAKRQRDMYVDLDTRLKRFEQSPAAAGAAPAGALPPPRRPPAAPATGAPAAPAAAAAAPPRRPRPRPSRRETHAYEAAQGQRRIGNYQGAIAAFQNFIAQYPEEPARAARPVLDRRFVLQPPRFQERDREPAEADRDLSRQRDDTGCAAQHRELPDRARRRRRRARERWTAWSRAIRRARRRKRPGAGSPRSSNIDWSEFQTPS